MTISFKVGQRYHNRDGEYEVVSVQGNIMTIRYTDGRVMEANMALQARILERMQDEDGYTTGNAPVQSVNEDGGDSRNTDEIRDFVAEILSGLRQPWPPDVTDRVFLNIESRRDRLSHYQKLVHDFGEPMVNSIIGRYVRQLTGMESSGREATPKSGLISSYSVLAPGKPKKKSR